MVSRSGYVLADPSLAVQPIASEFTRQDSGVFPSYPFLSPPQESYGTLTESTSNKRTPGRVSRSGYVSQAGAAGEDFFERMHVIPRSFALGFILATQTTAIEVYNAYRRQNNQWTGFTNNAGAGVSLIGDPGLPATVFAQGGIQMQLQVTPNGPPSVDSTLDFIFDVATLLVPITLERVVLFALRPENEYDEFLEWLTDVMPHKDGSEQRPSAREHPRQFFDFEYFLDDGTERSAIENLLFDWQSSIFGLPIWDQEAASTQVITAGDSTIFMDSTAYADYRGLGNFAVIFVDRTTFDVVPIQSVAPTSLVLASSVLNSYPVGTAVLPMRLAHARIEMTGTRSLNNVSKLKASFRCIDNDVGAIADLSAFSSFGGRLLYDGYNFTDGTKGEQFRREMSIQDNETGVVYQSSPWSRHRRRSGWSAIVRGKQEAWEHRQMLHAIRGRQVAWYKPADRDGMIPNLNLAIGSAALDIENQGYAQFVQSRQPRNAIRITFTNGDPALERTILSAVVVDSTRETLTLDGTWPATYTPAQVERIEFVEKVRFDSDRIKIRHGGAGGLTVRMSAPIRTVFN